MKNSHPSHKFIERVLTDDIQGDYDDDGFFITPNGSFWDPDGVYFNREGYDKHGGYYDDNNGEYIPGKGWDHINNCYYDDEDDIYDDEEEEGHYEYNDDDDLLDEEIPITADIEKIHISKEELEAIGGKPLPISNNKEDKKEEEKKEVKKKEPEEPVKKCRLAELFGDANTPNNYKKKKYVPRTRKYIYHECSKQEFDDHADIQNIHLVENASNNKSPKVFRMSNEKLKYSTILDNQVTASKICGIPQSMISQIILGKVDNPYNGWCFELLDEIERKESSAYQNHIMTVDGYTIKNINDGRILEFSSGQELKDYFGLNGHDVGQYIKNDHILMSEWEVISKSRKVLVNANTG